MTSLMASPSSWSTALSLNRLAGTASSNASKPTGNGYWPPPTRCAVFKATPTTSPASCRACRGALYDSSGEPGWASTPSWFIFGDGDNNIPVAVHRFMADRADAKTTEEIAEASHAVGVSQPDAVVAVIRRAMSTTRGTQSATV